MKLFAVLLVLAGGAYADRPGAVQVISTFKEVAPQYASSMNQNEEELQGLQHQGSDAIVNFHSTIITMKETFVLSVIKQEDNLQGLLATQDTAVADTQCMQFISTAATQNVNLVGVSYTTCINKADDALNTTASTYYGSIGNLEVAMTDLRLLDVFRGDNVFYTPQKIVDKLRLKLTDLSGSLTPLATDMEEQLDALLDDLQLIQDAYVACMTSAEIAFRQYITLAQTQLTAICAGSIPQPESTPVDVQQA